MFGLPLKLLKGALIASVFVVLADEASSATGPVLTPLKIAKMYTNNNSNAIYVEFQPGAMPGCYANAGGYMLRTNTFFKELLAQLMMLQASGGIGAAVLYTQNVQTGNWGDCTIDGLYLVP